MEDELKYIAPNKQRGMWSFVSWILIFVGAGFAWGWPVGLFFLGIDISLSCLIDNAVERFTKTTNWK